MNILVSSNDAYVMPLTVLLQSLFDNHDEPMTIWFLWSDLTEENRAFFRRLIESRGSELRLVEVGQTEFRGLPTKSYISRETYFRLLAAELLPATIERILWLDADMVVNGDIRPFYHLDLQGMAVGACPHGSVMRGTMRENCARIGIRYPEQYFNAGVMLCNLSRWRGMDIPGRIRQILSVPREMKFPGQDLTNLVFNGEVFTADWRLYNCMTHSILAEELPELRALTRIIHYAGTAKPWEFFDLPFSDIWMKYYERSPFAGKKLKQTSYFRMRDVCARAKKKREEMSRQAFFRLLNDCFGSAPGEREELRLRLGGRSIRIAFAGVQVSALMKLNLSLLLDPSPKRDEPDETVFVWKDDLDALRALCMIPPSNQGKKYQSTADYEICFPGMANRLSVRDKNTGISYVCFERNEDLPRAYFNKPFVNEMQWWIQDRAFILHGAEIGFAGKGALILGPSGSGKSTLALAGLLEGMDYVAEDYLLIDREGPIVGRPIFATGYLLEESLDMLPELKEHRLHYCEVTKKTLLDLSYRKEQFRENGLLAELILFPTLCGAAEPLILPMEEGPLLVGALASTAKQIRAYGSFAESFSILFERFRGMKNYELRLTNDPAKNALALKAFMKSYHRGET